jgi:hypothetical protein
MAVVAEAFLWLQEENRGSNSESKFIASIRNCFRQFPIQMYRRVGLSLRQEEDDGLADGQKHYVLHKCCMKAT